MHLLTSVVAQTVKPQCLPTMQETQVRALGQEDPLEEETATYSRFLAWRMRGLAGCSPWGHRVQPTE